MMPETAKRKAQAGPPENMHALDQRRGHLAPTSMLHDSVAWLATRPDLLGGMDECMFHVL